MTQRPPSAAALFSGRRLAPERSSPTRLSVYSRLRFLQAAAMIRSSLIHLRGSIMEYEVLMGLTFVVFLIIFAIGIVPRSGDRRRFPN